MRLYTKTASIQQAKVRAGGRERERQRALHIHSPAPETAICGAGSAAQPTDMWGALGTRSGRARATRCQRAMANIGKLYSRGRMPVIVASAFSSQGRKARFGERSIGEFS